jgi:hypothetical protein
VRAQFRAASESGCLNRIKTKLLVEGIPQP